MLEHLRSLGVFAKTAELGSFRAAARALSVSPSVVSHHVSELERRLSAPLLYRSTRRLALTPDGEKLFAAAREMLDAASRGLDAISGRSENPAGALRLTAPAFLGETSICRDLAAFSEAYPNVTLKVSFTDARRDLLRDGLDLGIRVGVLDDSTHKTRKLADMRRSVVCSPRYMGIRKAPRTLQDLKTWDYIQLSSRPAEIALTPPGKKTPVSLAFTPKMSIDSGAAIRELVIAGAGIATLPELIVRSDLARGSLVEVLPGWRTAILGVHAIWPSNAQRPELTLRFIDFMAHRIEALFAPPAP